MSAKRNKILSFVFGAEKPTLTGQIKASIRALFKAAQQHIKSTQKDFNKIWADFSKDCQKANEQCGAIIQRFKTEPEALKNEGRAILEVLEAKLVEVDDFRKKHFPEIPKDARQALKKLSSTLNRVIDWLKPKVEAIAKLEAKPRKTKSERK